MRWIHISLTYVAGIAISLWANLLTGTDWNHWTTLRILSSLCLLVSSLFLFLAAYRSEEALEETRAAGTGNARQRYKENFRAWKVPAIVSVGTILFALGLGIFLIDLYQGRK